MSETRHSVGDIIDSKCGTCKDVRRHTIMAIVEGTVVKVQCNTCGGMHKYRPPISETPARAARAAAPKKAGTKAPKAPRTSKAAQLLQDEWEALSIKNDAAKAVDYTSTTPFTAGDMVRHSKFGLGFVKKTFKPNKMEVLFKEGIKLMLCTAQ
ncbi:MAG: hypothetical protein AB7E47_16715 [Desulfovibrionaceae bacterium]